MSYIIGLNSIRLNAVDMVYVQVPELLNETLFSLDRSLRSVVKDEPMAEWSDFVSKLENDGFTVILDPRNNPVFVHSRPWDEHLIQSNFSFFVGFPSDAPYELAERLVLACNYAPLFAAVSADYVANDKVVLINEKHEAIYPDDMAWDSDEHTHKRPVGQLILIKDQFLDFDDYAFAQDVLLKSGYQILEDACVQ